MEFTHPASQYNQYLFDLYLTYLRRHRLSYDYLKPTRGLMRCLEQKPLTPIRSWNDIYHLSRRHPLTRSPGRPVHDNGCAWIKIGYMLLELGVLASRSDEYQHRLDTLLADMGGGSAEPVLAFAKCLKNSGRTGICVVRHVSELRALNHWLSELDPPETLLLAQITGLECYLDLMRQMHSYATTRVTFLRIMAFYRWAKRNRLILQNPTHSFRLSRATAKILITSKTQVDQLCAFARDPSVNPDHALAVTLILFFGLTTADLAGATLYIAQGDKDRMQIILPRKPRSRGRRYYNREQILLLPNHPPWLWDLTQRFCSHWRTRFAKIQPKTTFPKTPLFCDPQLLHNRNLSDTYISKLVKTATWIATGVPIPPRVLRQTCGHLMTRGDDASALGQLGWSPQFAFHYTWLPRVQFQPKPKA